MSLLSELFRTGALRPLDHALAQSLRRLDPTTPDLVLCAAALASLAVAQGHAGFDPANPQGLLEARVDWPPAQEWEQALLASRWIGTPASQEEPASTDVPLVYEEGLLYLRRYREYERRPGFVAPLVAGDRWPRYGQDHHHHPAVVDAGGAGRTGGVAGSAYRPGCTDRPCRRTHG